MVRGTRRDRLSVALLALLALGLPFLIAEAPAAQAAPIERTFTNAAGTRDYYLHMPPGATAGKPLMIYLHGCTDPQSQLADTGFSLTRLADEFGFVLAYPIQTAAANERYCWNWFDPANQSRGQGESSIIADLTNALIAEFGLDRARVYVGGYSAGGAMSTVLAAGYPDLYAAIAPMAGGPYGIDLKTFAADLSGTSIVAAMGARARPVPGFFLQDLADQTSLYPIGRANLTQWLGAYARAGDATVPAVPSVVTASTDPVPTTIERYAAGDCLLAEFRTPIGPDHIGGGLLMQSASGLDLQRQLMGFLLAHRLGGPRQACG
ncbi:extracellular catalytic domain type 1 short-chain-length polyhydroxyalkanoate depolymerase [Nocardia vulneris]|uniref:extracellular catalytic domain type 1 short-chain-length polyhydroxyalkanoate depolymerase n=1 Tax=Nocardia vulneris TaxID=1141657 RepID=UPI0006906D09|nr:PHB depolymerase family esterase [Nocardia vulneris]